MGAERRRPGRPERPLIVSDEPAAMFAIRLRDLRRAAGSPTYDAMSRRLGGTVSPAALSAAARGDRLPSWNTVHGFVLACGADPAHVADDFSAAGGTIPESVRSTLDSQTSTERHAHTNGTLRISTAPTRTRWWTIIAAVAVLLFTIALTAFITTIVTPHVPPPPTQTTLLPYAWQDQAGPGCGGNPVDLEPPNLPGHGWGGKATEPATTAPPSRQSAHPCSTTSSWVTLANAGADRWTHSATWTFEPGPHLTCQFRVYVPAIPQASGIATYDVYSGTNSRLSDRQTFAIRQGDVRGTWVTEGPFTFTEQHIRVVLANRSTTAGTIAVSSVHAYCH